MDLTISDDVPHGKTSWNFRERFLDLESAEPFFTLFLWELERLNLMVNEGKIVDASFIETPEQCNGREGNKRIRSGGIPDSFKESPHKSAQKDTGACWTKKNKVSCFGYINHVKSDAKSKIIMKFVVTDASIHDWQALDALLEEERDKGAKNFMRTVPIQVKNKKNSCGDRDGQQGLRKGIRKPTVNRRTTGNKYGKIKSALKSGTYIWFYGKLNERHVSVQHRQKTYFGNCRLDESDLQYVQKDTDGRACQGAVCPISNESIYKWRIIS